MPVTSKTAPRMIPVTKGTPKYQIGQRVSITVGKGRTKGQTNEIEMGVIEIIPKNRRNPEHRYVLKGAHGGVITRSESKVHPLVLPYKGHVGQK